MESLESYWALGHSYAKTLPIVGPKCIALAMPVAQKAAVVLSVSWILYRIWQIYKKPVDELVNLLGLEIPPAPEVSVAGITSESVVLYLKAPEQQHASLIHSIHPLEVGEINKGETSVQVTGLKPGHFYNIRVIASSTANFSTLGQLIRLRTLPPLDSKAHRTSVADSSESAEVHEATKAAAVRPAPAQYETPTTPHMARESSGGTMPSKRAVSGRRNSPASQVAEHPPSHHIHSASSERTASDESIEQLTKNLDSLRQQQHDLDKQMQEEETQSRKSTADLTEERDRLRQVLKEREDATAELRKQGSYLDKHHRNAQSRKAQKEQSLNQKKGERQRMKDDVVQWDEEIVVMRQDTQDMINQKADVLNSKDHDILQMRNTIAEEQAAIKSLEEEIRTTGAEIKAMEKDREKFSDVGDEEQQFVNRDRDDEEAWELRDHATYGELNRLWQLVQQLHIENERAKADLARWMAMHTRDPTQFVPISGLESTPSVRSNISRRNKQSNSSTSTVSSPSAVYALGPTAYSNMSSNSPIYSVPTSSFSLGNGALLSSPSDRVNLSQVETDIIAGGGSMSPTADDLLPSNLFRDDDAMARRVSGSAARESLGSFGSDVLARQGEFSSHGPHTPLSSSSRNGSQLSSPHDSLQNIPSYSAGGDPYADHDRRSISSTSASFHSPIAADANPLATNRFANLFSNTFNRQREKPGTGDPPQLGTLRQGQSQSFPRNYEQDLDVDLNGARQRRGSHGWGNPMGLLNRNIPGDSAVIRSLTGSGKKSRLNMIGPNADALQPLAFTDQPPSARPSSISSFDQVLGRPSSESQRNPWGLMPENIPNRSSPLGANWSSAASGVWSRGPSRRPSVQHGSTSNLSIGSTPLEPDQQGGLSNRGTEQLPIGTRPRGGSEKSSQRPMTPRLNPAAPSFKTLFSRGEGRKAAKTEKATEKIKEREIVIEDTDSTHDEPSPQNPRLSRDAQSIVTSTSVTESHESLDRSTSGTPSEVTTPSGPKETLMQRISRKGSSSKFNVPWGKERGGFFSRKTGDPSTPTSTPHAETDEDAGSEKHDESPHATEKSSRTSLSWPNIRRKSKRSGVLATEAGSEGGDDED